MEKIKVKKAVLSFIAVSFIMLMVGCVKDNENRNRINNKGGVSIAFKFKMFKKSFSLVSVRKAVVSMKKGGATFMTKKSFDVSYSGGSYSVNMDLSDGDYIIEELVLGTASLDATSGTYPTYGDATYFAPKKTDLTHKLAVKEGKLLPYSFKVSGGKASASGSSVGASGVAGSGDVGLDLVPVSPPNPIFSDGSNMSLGWNDVFAYGFKYLSGGTQIEDCVVKINKAGSGELLYYGITGLKNYKYSYFIFKKKDRSKYDFEISKFGYASVKASQLDADDSNKYNIIDKVDLRELSVGEAWVKPATTGGSADENLQRGGGDFASLSYWDHLPDKKAGVAGFFHLNKGVVNADTTKISSKYEVPGRDYKLKIDVYGNPSANTIFVVGLGDKTKYYKKYTPSPGVTPDGSSIANAYELPATSSSKEIDFGVVGKGKLSFGVYPSSEKSKVSFKVEELKLQKNPSIIKWSGGWRDDDAYTATITGTDIKLDVNSADFDTKVTLYPGGIISPDPNSVDWTNEVSFTVTNGAKTKTYKVKVTVNGKDIIKGTDANIRNTVNAEITRFGNIANLNHIDVNLVTDMSRVFAGKSNFNGDISKWDVSNVTNMHRIFFGAQVFNQDISGWKVDKVTDISGMFYGAKAFNQNIGGWDVSSVTTMESMFDRAEAFNQDISGWKVDNVTDMRFMFSLARAFNQDISGWNVDNVTDMSYMFYAAKAFNQDISGWKVDNVTYMTEMFKDAEAFNQDISGWKVDNVTDMRRMFKDAKAFNQDISGWKVDNVTDMRGMFNDAEAFNQDISGWKVDNVTNMKEMFRGAKAFNQDISGWKVDNVTDMRGMFKDAKAFNQDLSDWKSPKTDNVINCVDFSTGAIAWTKAKPRFNNCSP